MLTNPLEQIRLNAQRSDLELSKEFLDTYKRTGDKDFLNWSIQFYKFAQKHVRLVDAKI